MPGISRQKNTAQPPWRSNHAEARSMSCREKVSQRPCRSANAFSRSSPIRWPTQYSSTAPSSEPAVPAATAA
jgi:hypothetical protein